MLTPKLRLSADAAVAQAFITSLRGMLPTIKFPEDEPCNLLLSYVPADEKFEVGLDVNLEPSDSGAGMWLQVSEEHGTSGMCLVKVGFSTGYMEEPPEHEFEVETIHVELCEEIGLQLALAAVRFFSTRQLPNLTELAALITQRVDALARTIPL